MTGKEFHRELDKRFADFRLHNKNQLINGSKYATEIGSTQLEDIPYTHQLEIKKNILKDLFKDIVDTSIINEFTVIDSPLTTHYRFKAEFVTSFNPIFEPHNRLGQRKRNNFNWVVDLDEYILIDQEVFSKVRKVYDYALSLGLNGFDLKKHTGDLRYLTVKHYKDQLMLIITSYNLDNRFDKVMNYALQLDFNSVYWLVNNGLHDSFEGDIQKFLGIENLQIPVKTKDRSYTFLVGPFTFFQNNIYCFEKLLDYIDTKLSELEISDLNLYDLYCGVGLLGIVFANKFNKVFGVEIIQESIDLAMENQRINNIANIKFECFDVKNLSLEQDFNSISIIDPPRTGLEDKGISNLKQIGSKYLIYVSCNPVTLAADIKALDSNYKVLDLKVFDMFPQTYHTECLCILEKY